MTKPLDPKAMSLEQILDEYIEVDPEANQMYVSQKALKRALLKWADEQSVEAYKIARHDVDFARRWSQPYEKVLKKMDRRIKTLTGGELEGGMIGSTPEHIAKWGGIDERIIGKPLTKEEKE